MSLECSICAETKASTDFPITRVTRDCTHPSTTCLQCIATAIRTAVQTENWMNVTCPDCSAKLRYEDVQCYADVGTKLKYADLSARHAIQQDENFIWVRLFV